MNRWKHGRAHGYYEYLKDGKRKGEVQSIEPHPCLCSHWDANPNEQPEGGRGVGSGLAAEKIAHHRNRVAIPRDYVDGYVAGGCFESVAPPLHD